ncbi:hypothetical protein [Streptosporangium longisporum]
MTVRTLDRPAEDVAARTVASGATAVAGRVTDHRAREPGDAGV